VYKVSITGSQVTPTLTTLALGCVPGGANCGASTGAANTWTGLQTFNTGGGAGTRDITVGNLGGIVLVDGVRYTTIANAILGLPAAGGTVIVPPGYTETLTAPLIVGTTTQMVNLMLDRTDTLTINMTGGQRAIQVGPGSAIIGQAEVETQSGLGAIKVSNGSIIANVIYLNNQGGAFAGYGLENIQIFGNSLPTISDAVINMTNPLQVGVMRGVTVGGFSNTTLLKITQTAGQPSSGISFYDLQLNCQALVGCKPLLIQSVAGGGAMGSINFYGGTYTHPGAGGLAIIDLQGITGSDCDGISFYSPLLESSNAADIGFRVNNCSNVVIDNPFFSANVNPGTDAIRISGLSLNFTARNVNNFNLWTNTINNTVSGYVLTAAQNPRPAFYNYGNLTTAQEIYDNNIGAQLTVSGQGVLTVKQPITSLVATGTAPLTVSSTTPVANLTDVPNCGNAAGAQQTGCKIVFGTSTLVAGTVTVTLTAPYGFTSGSSYSCSWNRTVNTAMNVAYTSGTQFVLTSATGTDTDAVRWQCVGN
jgi:hypothetical protein